MSYYSNRLYWLSDDGLVTLLTTRSKHYTVTELPSNGDITSFTMVYIPPALRFLKGNICADSFQVGDPYGSVPRARFAY